MNLAIEALLREILNTPTHWVEAGHDGPLSDPSVPFPKTWQRQVRTEDVDSRFMPNTLGTVMRAVIEGRFTVFYQPCLDVRTGRINHLEALLRWPSAPEGLTVQALVAALERNGLILQVGSWAMRSACSALARFRREGYRDLTMSVNISPSQVFDANLPDLVARCLAEGHIPANRLYIELTETMVPDLVKARALVDALRRLGVQTIIDDFGVGFSSMNLLKELPAKAIKLDRSFVSAHGGDRKDRIVAEAIVSLANQLNLEVIAEGVETPAQLRWLKGLGVHRVQGFLYSPAVSIESISTMLATQPFMKAWKETCPEKRRRSPAINRKARAIRTAGA